LKRLGRGEGGAGGGGGGEGGAGGGGGGAGTTTLEDPKKSPEWEWVSGRSRNLLGLQVLGFTDWALGP
jgi:hypothetical protein